MYDNFEKEVQQKMEELALNPSAPVWEKVEAEIKVKKRRKRTIFWFLFTGLLFAGGGWWVYQSLRDDNRQLSLQTNMKASKNLQTDTVLKSSETSKNKNNPIFTDTVSIKKLTNHQQKNGLRKSEITKPVRIDKNDRKAIIKTVTPDIDREKTNAERTIILMPAKEKINSNSLVIVNSRIETSKALEDKQPLANIIIVDSQEVSKQQLSSVKDSSFNLQIKADETLPVTKDSSLKKKVAATNKKWKKQINVGAGWADYNESAAAIYSVSNLSQSPPLSSFTGSFQPQKTSAGFGFSIGFALSKQLSQKWEMTFGLQYAHNTTHTKLGDKKQQDTTVNYAMDKSLVNEFFTNSAKNNYTNRFDVLELPVSVSYQPSIKLPLYFSIGAAYGRLLSTNALTFSNTSNLYYQNKDNYVRNMLPVSSSIQVRLLSKKGLSIRTGPFVQYNLLKLRKENTTNKPHQFFAGIKTGINF